MCKKFLERGVNLQYEAYSKANANKRFKISCDICSQQGKHLDCDK